MAHAIWHIEPSFYKKYWADKLKSGALAAQEGVIDPMLDRMVGTAPGIPARPFFGGESGGPPAKATGKGPPPRLFFGGGMGPSMEQMTPINRSLVGQGPIPKGTPGVGDKPIAWEWTEDAGLGQQRLTPQKVQPQVPVVAPARSVAADPSQYPVSMPGGFGPEKAAALSRGERGRSAIRPPSGPFKKQIAEASADEGPAATEQDKLRRMLKMMFLSDLIKGTEAPSPDYYSAVSVGPASRAFAPLPSMFRGR